MTMRIAVTGSTGLIGTALVTHLHAEGHDVVRMVRRPPRAPDEVRWDPTGGTVDVEGLAGVDGVVHLAGAGVGDHRWTDSYKQELWDSRVIGTRTLVSALTSMDRLPDVLVMGSAIGYYGDRGDEVLTETSAPGEGFLADMLRGVDAETDAAAAAGIRVATSRTGLVIAPQGGAFGRLLTLVKLGLGGPLGNGRQWWSWVSLPDVVDAITFMLAKDVAGPVNLTSPEPARNLELVRAIGSHLHRPTLLPAPRLAMRIVLGEMVDEVVLSSQRVIPTRLVDAGYSFRHPSVDSAAGWLAEG
jgi:uncharacterized protein (TIGR01777 family)